MKNVTLCVLLETDRVCLALKKRGFGEGKLNGYGGKVLENESVPAAAIRELLEESAVRASEQDLEPAADIEFSFEEKPEWSQRMHVFLLRRWEGIPEETEEMAPEWFALDALPYDRMWASDREWLPRVLAGERLTGSCHFSADGSVVLKSELRAR